MKIVSVEAIPMKAQMKAERPYWGTGFWAESPEIHPGLSPSYPGDITTEYPALWRNRCIYSKTVDTTLVKITADSGVVGWGEAHAPVAPEVYKEIIDRILAPLLLDTDPLEIGALWEKMYSTKRLRGHNQGFLMEAIAGVDIALWDLAGKALNIPVHTLLGGKLRDRVKVYGSSLPAVSARSGNDGWEGLQDMARETVGRGFRALKMKIGLGPERDIHSVELVREVVGDDIAIMVDAGGAYDVAMAKAVCRELTRLKVLFLEEPVPPEFIEGYAQIRSAVDVHIAGGECLCNRFWVNEYLRRNAFDVIQPDVSRSGGITETKRIAELADIYGVACAPHNSIGSAIYQAAVLQLAAVIPNLLIMELWMADNPLGNAILKTPLAMRDGYMIVPEGPGLGVEVDEAAVMSHVA